jgi:hypothetical protein
LYFSAKSRALDSGKSGLVRQAVIRFQIPGTPCLWQKSVINETVVMSALDFPALMKWLDVKPFGSSQNSRGAGYPKKKRNPLIETVLFNSRNHKRLDFPE